MTLAEVSPAPGLVSPVTGLAPATEAGTLGIYQLKRLWSRSMAARAGRVFPTTLHDRHLDNLVIHASGLGLEQTASFLGQQAPSFEAFERWILATTGGIDPKRIGFMGFSAGGELAALMETHFAPETRPDFAVVVYPGFKPGAVTVPKSGIAGAREFTVARDRGREKAMETIRRLARPLPAGFKFDREEMNER